MCDVSAGFRPPMRITWPRLKAGQAEADVSANSRLGTVYA